MRVVQKYSGDAAGGNAAIVDDGAAGEEGINFDGTTSCRYFSTIVE